MSRFSVLGAGSGRAAGKVSGGPGGCRWGSVRRSGAGVAGSALRKAGIPVAGGSVPIKPAASSAPTTAPVAVVTRRIRRVFFRPRPDRLDVIRMPSPSGNQLKRQLLTQTNSRHDADSDFWCQDIVIVWGRISLKIRLTAAARRAKGTSGGGPLNSLEGTSKNSPFPGVVDLESG